MNFLARLRAMLSLGESTDRLGQRSRERVIVADDAARLEVLGDIEGQTARASAFAVELDRMTLGR